MPTQYGELKNGLRAYITYTLTTTATTYTLTTTNAGIMAPAPVAKDITLAEGSYYLQLTDSHGYSPTPYYGTYVGGHTFAKGNSDRWLQVFLGSSMGVNSQGNLDHSTHTATILMRRDTSPIYQTTATITIPQKAHWTVSYNANGGSGAPSAQTKWHGETLTLSSTRPTRTGYTFKGWATTQARANAGTVDYSAGGTYSANSTSNITLWAAWSLNPYAVTYNANGGSGAPASQTKYHGTNLTLQSGVPVKAGWLFRGWATSEANATARKNSGTAEYLPGGTYTGNEPLTLWAIWHAIYTYSISAKRVGADKSSTEDTNGEWVRIEVSITSAEASGNPVTAITFTDEETVKSVSWYATNDGSGSAITFPYQPTADNIKLYAWYQRTTASERAERYNLSAKVDDAIKTGDIKTTTLPPVFRLIDAKPPGKGIAFGKAATEDDLFECELDAMFNNSLKKINADGTEIDFEISDATIALYDQLAGGTGWREVGGMLDRLFSLIVQVLGLNVVDRGTEGIWAYKKYGDGTYTAWFDAAVNLNNGTLWSGGFYYHQTRSSYTVPSFSRAVTSIEANANGDQLTWFVGYTVTNGEYQLFFADAVAAQRENIPVRVVVKGRWK